MAAPIPNLGLGGRHIYTASTLPPGKCSGCPFNRILVGPQSRPGRWAEEKERTTSSVGFPGRCPPMWCWWNWMKMEKCAYFNICGWRGMTVLHCCVVYGSEHITLFCCFLLNGEMNWSSRTERETWPTPLSVSLIVDVAGRNFHSLSRMCSWRTWTAVCWRSITSIALSKAVACLLIQRGNCVGYFECSALCRLFCDLVWHPEPATSERLAQPRYLAADLLKWLVHVNLSSRS
jgi:hypothetical protein